MFRAPHHKKELLATDVNNFLKTDAEIVTDFKVRIQDAIQHIDKLHDVTEHTHGRIIKKTAELDYQLLYLSESLYLEENY